IIPKIKQIKEITKDAHVRAENTQLMLNYQKGQITQAQYKLLLCSLYEIYRVLEQEMDRNSRHPAVEPIYFPQELARVEALERDLEFFFGLQWRKRVTVPAATLRYAERLREIGRSSPNLLVAHAYTRYLGDLSGGQVLGKITQKTMGLSGNEGVAFFSFPEVSSAHRFKQMYRSRMNSIELSEEERKKVLDEAVKAFEFNIEERRSPRTGGKMRMGGNQSHAESNRERQERNVNKSSPEKHFSFFIIVHNHSL
uniref:heme oxygenase (biliverdin-producing) n=2 Tax=Astyanax mexicanus TaxID=7994 RepID=A0A8B9GT80_ASTMX